jgi:hypothetical protein
VIYGKNDAEKRFSASFFCAPGRAHSLEPRMDAEHYAEKRGENLIKGYGRSHVLAGYGRLRIASLSYGRLHSQAGYG